MAKRAQHGGKRVGAGRKGLGPDQKAASVVKSFTLTQRHLTLLTRFMKKNGLSSMSEAMRKLIEEATKDAT